MLFEIIATCKGGGYMYCRTDPPHPKANANGLYPLHRVLAENKLGRLLADDEVVHHIDEDKSNNDPANLAVMTRDDHTKLHNDQFPMIPCTCHVCGKRFELKQIVYSRRKNQNEGREPCCSPKCERKIGRMKDASEALDLQFKVTPDEWIDIEELLTLFHPENSQVATEGEDAAIQDSILRRGFVAEMLVLNPWNRKLVSGHQRTRNCYELGYRGKLPVVYLEMTSEEDHRLAMLQFNRARGHQDQSRMLAEIEYLLKNSTETPAEIAVALAKSEEEIKQLLALANPEPAPEQPEDEPAETNPEDFWPTIKLQVHPETYELYESLMQDAPGATDYERFAAILRCVDLSAVNWDEEDEE